MVLSYLTFALSIGFALAIPWMLKVTIDALVIQEEIDGILNIVPLEDLANVRVDVHWSPWDYAMGCCRHSVGGQLVAGFFDFARTYTSDSLAQKVAYDYRNLMYDKLQHLSFAFHDKEHTGNLYSKATADVEAIRRFVMMGMVRSTEVVARVAAISVILAFMHWQLALLSLIFLPFVVGRSTSVLLRLRIMWLRSQEIMGELVTVLQENLSGIHVVKGLRVGGLRKKRNTTSRRVNCVRNTTKMNGPWAPIAHG